ncbi:MAG: hypothetical protein RQ760_09210 [Sedimentisphaerales bacterium]|nr:hypothetical protein [Sedimentisphaerales bacterium]
MGSNRWIQVDRIMRYIHLYTGLFLMPWIAVYATSAFCLNHNKWFREKLKITPPKWEHIREVEFVPDEAFPQVAADQARAILQLLDLDGPHNIQGKPNAKQMIIFRICGSGNYRITWRRPSSLIVVEKQGPFSLYRLVHFLHFRGGYAQPYFANITWAVIVDGVAVSMLLWVLTGVYLWYRRSRRLLIGTLCVVTGLLLFICLTVLFCT